MGGNRRGRITFSVFGDAKDFAERMADKPPNYGKSRNFETTAKFALIIYRTLRATRDRYSEVRSLFISNSQSGPNPARQDSCTSHSHIDPKHA